MSAEPVLPGLAVLASAVTGWGIRNERAARECLGKRTEATISDLSWDAGGDGPPLVLLNGIAASGLVWPSGWVRELERTHRVIRIDGRGTGGSRRAPAPFTIADLAADVAAILDVLGIDSPTVLGFSMGGIVAQEFALRFPERVDRLMLVSSVPPTPAHIQATDYRPFLDGAVAGARSSREGWTTALARFYLGTSSPRFKPSDQLVDELATQLSTRPTSVFGAIQHARAIVAWRDPERLGSLRVPTTVVAGLDDPIALAANGGVLSRLIPGARLVELPDVGHMVPWEAGDVLVDVVR